MLQNKIFEEPYWLEAGELGEPVSSSAYDNSFRKILWRPIQCECEGSDKQERSQPFLERCGLLRRCLHFLIEPRNQTHLMIKKILLFLPF